MGSSIVRLERVSSEIFFFNFYIFFIRYVFPDKLLRKGSQLSLLKSAFSGGPQAQLRYLCKICISDFILKSLFRRDELSTYSYCWFWSYTLRQTLSLRQQVLSKIRLFLILFKDALSSRKFAMEFKTAQMEWTSLSVSITETRNSGWQMLMRRALVESRNAKILWLVIRFGSPSQYRISSKNI